MLNFLTTSVLAREGKACLYFRLIALALIGSILLMSTSSCIEPKPVECIPGAYFSFSYTQNKENKDLFEGEVERLNLLIYDSLRVLYKDTVIHRSKGPGQNTFFIPLPIGTYHLLAWCGDIDRFELGRYDSVTTHEFSKGIYIDSTTLNETCIRLKGDQTGAIYDFSDTLYHGFRERILSTFKGYDYPIDLSCNTNNVRVVISGLPDGTVEGIQARLLANNSRYSYCNELLSVQSPFYYHPLSRTTGDAQLEFVFETLRIMVDEPLQLLIENLPQHVSPQKSELVNLDIVFEFMNSPLFSSQQDFDRERNYLIQIEFDSFFKPVIYVNGWKVVDIKPEL